MEHLLRELDAYAQSQETRWGEKRNRGRRQFHAPCEVYYPAPDGATVHKTNATTRDISEGGLGFVAAHHFSRNVPLLVAVTLLTEHVKNLTGRVVYSRRVNEEWYLTGVKFAALDDDVLTRAIREGTLTEAQAAHAADRPGSNSGRTLATVPAGQRERALAVLAAAGASRIVSRETATKVISFSVSSDHVVRRATIPVLMQIPSPEGTLALIELLHDPNPTVQGEAAEALGRLRATRAVESLRRLLRHADETVALRAAEALGRMNDQSGIHLVARLVRRDTALKGQAARTLGVIIGQPLRATTEGVEAARRYLKVNKIK